MSATIQPRPGFDWTRVNWGGPDEPRTDRQRAARRAPPAIRGRRWGRVMEDNFVPAPPMITLADQVSAVERALRDELRMIRKGHHIAALRAALATLRVLAEMEAGDG